jgi:hypothetical protein
MAWTPHGFRRPRRRRGDWRPPPPEASHRHAGDLLSEPPVADPWLVLNREIDRCRRYRHPLALVRVTVGEPGGTTSLAARPRREGRPYRRRVDPTAALAAALRRSARSGDVTWIDGPAVFVLAPETDAPGAEAMAARVRAIAADVLGATVDLRIAAFPEDGLTGHALRAALTARQRRFRHPAGREQPAPDRAPARAWAGSPRLADGPAAPALHDRRE